MLKVENLSISLTLHNNNLNEIVHDISFTIAQGQTLSIIGESGSGKTLTALSLARLLPKYSCYSASSKIYLDDIDLLNLTERKMQKIRGAKIAMIFQEPMSCLNPIYTNGSQIIEVLNIHRNMYGKDAYTEAIRLLEIVRMREPVRCFSSYPHEISGGMQQRVMIAMALAGKPQLLVADEPTTALDVTTQIEILNLLTELQHAENMSVLLITHDLAIASRMADNIAVMQNGRFVEQNTCDDFFKKPQHKYSLKLLASTPANLPNHSPSGDNKTILTVSDLRVYFPIKRGLFKRTVDYVKAVDNVSFDIMQAKTTALVGESGSGKSTIAKAILGLIKNTSGIVKYNGVDLLKLNSRRWLEYRGMIQIIFQDPYSSLDPKLTVATSLMEGLLLRKEYSKKAIKQKIDELLVLVGLHPECQNKYPHEFSGGERQRICIARALSLEPKIIICDEPTSSLDVSVQAQVLELLQKLQQQKGIAYLFITHDLNLVRMLADNVVVMKNGKFVETGTYQEIFTAPRNEYTRTLLNAILKIKR